jgi:hypothetical protein
MYKHISYIIFLSTCALAWGMENTDDTFMPGPSKEPVQEEKKARPSTPNRKKKKSASTVLSEDGNSKMLNVKRISAMMKNKHEEVKVVPSKDPFIQALNLVPYKAAIKLAKKLINKGHNLNTVEEPSGDTYLHVAARKGYLEIVELLLEKGAAINAQNRFGATPLMAAAANERKEVVKLLMERGADDTIKNKFDQGAHTMAIRNGRFSIEEAMREKSPVPQEADPEDLKRQHEERFKREQAIRAEKNNAIFNQLEVIVQNMKDKDTQVEKLSHEAQLQEKERKELRNLRLSVQDLILNFDNAALKEDSPSVDKESK